MTWRTGWQLIKNKLWNCGFSVYVGFFLRTCIVKDVTMTVSSSVRWWLRKKTQLFAVLILNSFEQLKYCFIYKTWQFLINSLYWEGWNSQLMAGLVNSDVVLSDRQSMKLSIKKKFRIALFDIGTLRGRSSEVVKTMSRRSVDLFCLQEIRRKSDGVMHLLVW